MSAAKKLTHALQQFQGITFSFGSVHPAPLCRYDRDDWKVDAVLGASRYNDIATINETWSVRQAITLEDYTPAEKTVPSILKPFGVFRQ